MKEEKKMSRSNDDGHTVQAYGDLGKWSRRNLLRGAALVSSKLLCAAPGLLVLKGCSRETQRLDALYGLLAEEMDRESALRLFNRIAFHYAELDSRKPHYAKWGMRFNIGNAILALAIYRALGETGRTREASITKAGELVWATMPLWLFRKVFWFIGQFPDPFAAFVWFTRQQCKIMFPEPGWKRSYSETGNCFGFDVTRCLYIDYLTKEGAPELVIAMCDLDYRTAELFPPDFYFKRTRCLAEGDTLCDFRYCRRRR